MCNPLILSSFGIRPHLNPQKKMERFMPAAPPTTRGKVSTRSLPSKRFQERGFNLKLLVEGEEEIGSPGLAKLCEEKREALKADHVLLIDAEMPARGVPGLTLGVRGITTMEVQVRGSDKDLHSGGHGGIAYNPARALCEALAKVWEDGRIVIPGFYDGIDVSDADLDMDFDLAEYTKTFGVRKIASEEPLRANWLEPTVEINGINSGYTGKGFKTIIPAIATAKISARLVPGQDPDRIAKLIADFLKEQMPQMEVHVELDHGGLAVQTSRSNPMVEQVAKALENVFEKECKFIMSGGSIPISAALAKASGGDVLFMGVALPEDAIHSPNEHFDVERLRLGFLSMVELLK